MLAAVGLLVLFEPQKHGFRAARAAIALPESRGGPLGDRMTTCDMAAFVQPCACSYPQLHGKGYVWVPGYHRWDGSHYVWEKGRWDRPPHEHARWIAPRWVRRRDGYVFVEGHWS